MNWLLVTPIILILAAALVWSFIEPYVLHRRARRAAAQRRIAERPKHHTPSDKTPCQPR